MDRREVLKASLVGAASMGVPTNFSTGRSHAAERAATAEPAAAAGVEMPLVSVFDYDAAAKRKLSFGGW